MTGLAIDDRGVFVSTGEDGRVVRWKLGEIEYLKAEKEDRPIRGLILDGADDSKVVYATDDGRVRRFQTDESSQHPGRLDFLCARSPGRCGNLVTAGERLVRIGKLEPPHIASSPRNERANAALRHGIGVSSLALGTGFFLSGGSDGAIMLVGGEWETGAFHVIRTWQAQHSGPVTVIRVSDRFLVTAGKDGRVFVWRADFERLEFDLHANWKVRAAVTAMWASDQEVVWAGVDGRVFLGNTAKGLFSLLWKGKGNEVTALDAREEMRRRSCPSKSWSRLQPEGLPVCAVIRTIPKASVRRL